jgi:RNA polymerase-binding protein DksA
MTTIQTDRFRQLLEEERKRVADAIEHLHTQSQQLLEDEAGQEPSFDNHPGDAATTTFERELEQTLEGTSETILKAIDRALARIEDGTYGTCQRCGQAISEERLEAMPYAELCIDCKRKAERF